MRLKIIHLNVRHWINTENINAICNYFLQQNPDVITINSHSITKTDKYVKLANYSAYTKNKEKHAGVAILIKMEIPHTFHTNTLNKNILAATLQTKQNKLTIVTFYRPPRQTNLPLMDINNYLQLNNPTLILADANIKHQHFGHTTTDQNGKILNNYMQFAGLHYIGPQFNTFYEGNKKGKPDIILGNTTLLSMAHYTKEGSRLTSTDHIPIIMELSTSPMLIEDKLKYNYNKANWENFTQHMNTLQIPNIINMSTDEIEKQWEIICSHIIEGADAHIPKTKYKLIPAQTLSTRTKNLLRIYNERHNIYKDNITQEKIQILNNIKNHINSSKAKDICDFWSKKIDELEELKLAKDPKNFFKNIKNMMGKQNYNLGTHLIHNNIEIHDAKQQADLLATTWENIIQPNTPKNTEEVSNNIQKINQWT